MHNAALDFFHSAVRTPLLLSALSFLTYPFFRVLLEMLPVWSDAAVFSFLSTALHLLFYLGVNGGLLLLPSLGIGNEHIIPRSDVCCLL